MPILFFDDFNTEMPTVPITNFSDWVTPTNIVATDMMSYSPPISVDIGTLRNLQWWGTNPFLWEPFDDDTPIKIWFYISNNANTPFELFFKEGQNTSLTLTTGRIAFDMYNPSLYGESLGIYAKNGGSNVLVGHYMPDTWFCITIVHNADLGTFSLWLDNNMLVNNFISVVQLNTIGAVGFRSRGTGLIDLIFMDDFQVGEMVVATPLIVKNSIIKSAVVGN